MAVDDDDEVRSRYLLLTIAVRNFLNDTLSQIHFHSLAMKRRKKLEKSKLRLNSAIAEQFSISRFFFFFFRNLSDITAIRKLEKQRSKRKRDEKDFIFLITQSFSSP